MRYSIRIATLLPLMAASVGLICGCGGGSSGAKTGRASFTILWPTQGRARVIPASTKSVRIIVRNGPDPQSPVLDNIVVPIPTTGVQTTTTISDLPLGTLSTTVSAYPNIDATGPVPIATATAPF